MLPLFFLSLLIFNKANFILRYIMHGGSYTTLSGQEIFGIRVYGPGPWGQLKTRIVVLGATLIDHRISSDVVVMCSLR